MCQAARGRRDIRWIAHNVACTSSKIDEKTSSLYMLPARAHGPAVACVSCRLLYNYTVYTRYVGSKGVGIRSLSLHNGTMVQILKIITLL